MEDKKIKKKKLTISVTSKKKTEPLNYTRGIKSSVVVEKKRSRKKNQISSFSQKDNFNKNQKAFNKKTGENKSSSTVTNVPKKNFDIRKMAEQRATRRFKDKEEQLFKTIA